MSIEIRRNPEDPRIITIAGRVDNKQSIDQYCIKILTAPEGVNLSKLSLRIAMLLVDMEEEAQTERGEG